METGNKYTVGKTTAKVLDALRYLQKSVFLIEEAREELYEKEPQGFMEKYYALHNAYLDTLTISVENSPFSLATGVNEI